MGVKPVCNYHQVFKSTWLFGAFSPIDGASFMLTLPACNTDTFQLFLKEMSSYKPNELKVIVLDNGAFHKAKRLIIPGNILLVFLPPYSPELNPAEKIWQQFKRAFTNHLFTTLDEVDNFITEQTILINDNIVKKTCRYGYIFVNEFWSFV